MTQTLPEAQPRPAPPALPVMLRVAVLMAGAIGGFVAMAMAGRAVARWHDTFEIMTWRSAVGLVVVLGVALARGQTGQIRARNLGLHLARNLSHFAGQNLWFAALTLIPLAQLFALEFAYPLLVALAAPLVLGETFSARRLLAVAMGFAGVVIVAQPWGAGGLSAGTGIAILAALGFAGSALMTKRLTGRAPMLEILFWLTLLQLVFGLVSMLADGVWRLPNAHSAPLLLLIGLAGLGAHFCLTRALALAPASVVVPIDFLRLPLIAAVGALIYDEPLSRAVALGGAIILWANWINARPGPGAATKLNG